LLPHSTDSLNTLSYTGFPAPPPKTTKTGDLPFRYYQNQLWHS
jgi:hypothetical protein